LLNLENRTGRSACATEKKMPITKSGRYSMNPAYAQALDRAAEEERNAKNGKDAGEDGNDGSDGSEDSAASDGDDAASKPRAKNAGENSSQKSRPVKRIEIEPAENGGFVSRTEREQSDDEDGGQADGWAPPYQEPELRAHPDGVDLMKFLGQALGM
jgi:hypothetical protein